MLFRSEQRECRPARLAEVAAEAGVKIEDAAQTHDVTICAFEDADDVSADLPDPADALAGLQAVREAVVRYQRMPDRWRTIVDDWLDERPQVETAAALGVTSGRVTQLRGEALARIAG